MHSSGDERELGADYMTDIEKYFADDNSSHGLRYYWKRRYKYILSRYGYSVNLAALETFNEIDQVLGYNSVDITSTSTDCGGNRTYWNADPALPGLITNWHNDILNYAKNTLMNNANKHLAMVSYCSAGGANPSVYYGLLTNSFIDIADIHDYDDSKTIFNNSFGIVSTLVRNTLALNKPFHFGEFSAYGNIYVSGLSSTRDSDTMQYFNHEEKIKNIAPGDPLTYFYFNNYDISFHNELWASAFMGTYSTGLNYAWNTVHWWPISNPTRAYYTATDFATVDNVLGDQQSPPLLLPGNQTINFTNKKIYHNFKPLSDFMTQSPGIDFKQHYTPYELFGDGSTTNSDYTHYCEYISPGVPILDDNGDILTTATLECYYLVNDDATNAYGWVHNLDYFWHNNYYYYSDGTTGTGSINYEKLNGCTVPYGTTLSFPLPDFAEPADYIISFYPTRTGSYSVPAYAVIPSTTNGLDIGPSIQNYFTYSGYQPNDTIHVDVAFEIEVSLESTHKTTNVENKQNDTIDFNVLISPNPSDGIYYIKVNKTGLYNISVYNSIGDIILVENEINKNTDMDLSNQPAGIYYVKVSEGNNIKHFKLIKR